MFSTARSAFGHVLRAKGGVRPLARRVQTSSQGARTAGRRNGLGLRSTGFGVIAGLGFAAWYTSSSRAVHLDSPDRPKSKRGAQDTKPQEPSLEPEASSSGSTPTSAEEFLQKKEDEALEEVASSPPDGPDAEGSNGGGGGAYNPETGEINWDCPCLGGMAHGPCGQEFRDAFSCFVYSEEEPKGINCVEKFKAMQDCFRRHPEVYGEEIMADDDEEVDDQEPSQPSRDPTEEPAPTSEAAPAVPQNS